MVINIDQQIAERTVEEPSKGWTGRLRSAVMAISGNRGEVR